MAGTGLAHQVTATQWQVIREIAPVLHQSRLFGVSSPEQAMAIALKGVELGLGMTSSYEFIHIIQGRPTLSPRGALALIYRSGELEDIVIDESKVGSCTVRMKRKSGVEYQLTWTLDDAKRTGLIKAGSGWDHYPKNMLRWRCVGFVADVVFPDIQGGLRRADELGALVDDKGDIVDAQWTTTPVVPVSAPTVMEISTPEPPPSESSVAEPTAVSLVMQPEDVQTSGQRVWKLEELIEEYGADAVFEAAGDSVPGTDEEVQQVAQKLSQVSNRVPF